MVTAAASPLFARVAGGSRSVARTDVLVLDGTSSEDPDREAGALSYTWRCFVPLSNQPCLNASLGQLRLPDVGVQTFAPLSLPTGDYSFELIVAKGQRTSASSVVTISVLPATLPVLVDPSSLALVSVSQRLVLHAVLPGYVANRTDLAIQWSVSSCSLFVVPLLISCFSTLLLL